MVSEGVRSHGGCGVICGHLVSDKELSILLWKRLPELSPMLKNSDSITLIRWVVSLGHDVRDFILIFVSVRTS